MSVKHGLIRPLLLIVQILKRYLTESRRLIYSQFSIHRPHLTLEPTLIHILFYSGFKFEDICMRKH